MAEETGRTIKVAASWSAVVLALIGGITGGFGWVANHVAEPLVKRLIDNMDFQESNAKQNTEAITGVKDELHALNSKQTKALEKQEITHELQREQIHAAEKAAEVLQLQVPNAAKKENQ